MKHFLLIPVALCACLRSPLDDFDLPSGSSSTSDEISESSGSYPPIMTTTASPGSTSEPTDGSSGSGTFGDSASTGDSTSKCGTAEEECLPDFPDCSESCTWKLRTVFVSSAAIFGDFDGLTPDEFCMNSAKQACDFLPTCSCNGNCNFRALILMPDGNFWSATSDFQGRYVNSLGESIGVGLENFQHPKNIFPTKSEFGEEIDGLVWTGMDSDNDTLENTCYSCDGDQCTHWSSDIPIKEGWVGNVGGDGNSWYQSGSLTCSEKAHVYCVG